MAARLSDDRQRSAINRPYLIQVLVVDVIVKAEYPEELGLRAFGSENSKRSDNALGVG
jgi:hypothetical protein